MTHWDLKAASFNKALQLSEQLGISPITAQVLVNRGLEKVQDIQLFLSTSLKDLPDPFLIKDMDKAVDRLVYAIKHHQKIVVYGDYDVDGTTASSLLYLFFKECGVEIQSYIPHRINEGYSLNKKALETLKQNGAEVIITVDNGISAENEINFANEINLDLIVTDHHQVPEKLPKALAILNPQRVDCPYPAKEICGTGVAFNLMMALRLKLKEDGFFDKTKLPNLKKYLDLVALATVADVVSLVGANRIFVKVGLEILNQTVWPGLKALMQVSGIKDKPKAYDLGFKLGPRINACGRLYDASLGFKLLTSTDIDKALELANELNQANDERKQIESQILKEAISQVEDNSLHQKYLGLVLQNENWHPGVIGIVASRMVERYSRPVIMLGVNQDEYKGSARSFKDLNLVEALKNCSHFLTKFGGHKAAAGLALQKENLENFREAFDQTVRQHLNEKDCVPQIKIDADLKTTEINERLIREVQKLEPFGMGNATPTFCLKEVSALNQKIVGDKHLKFKINHQGQTTDAIAFGMAELKPNLSEKVDLAFQLSLNLFNGIESIQLNIKDIKL